MSKTIPIQDISNPHFPRSNRYDPEWVRSTASGGANALWLAEWLTGALQWTAGMRVLDLGCGSAATSIFLCKEFGVQVWATDLWFNPSENYKRICQAGVQHSVFPIHADARNLPFAREFFDAIISIDSFPYYGTDFFYLKNLARFVKSGGLIAIAGAGMVQEIKTPVPTHLESWLQEEPEMMCLHSAKWWADHWSQSAVVDVELADTMRDGWKHWLQWHRFLCPENHQEINSIEADQGRYMGYIRVVARRRLGIEIMDPITSVSLA